MQIPYRNWKPTYSHKKNSNERNHNERNHNEKNSNEKDSNEKNFNEKNCPEKNGGGRKLFLYLITAVMAISAALGLNILMIFTGLLEQSEAYRQVAQRQYSVAFGTGIVLYGFVYPLIEEIIFRGFFYRILRKYVPAVFAIAVSAVLFGVYHGNLVQGIYGFCMGVLIALVYEKTGDFAIPCLFHATANLAVYSITNSNRLYEKLMRPAWGALFLLIFGGTAVCLHHLTNGKEFPMRQNS